MSEDETVRVDRWLWSIRLYPSRTAATDACDAGHVRIDRRPAKPATKLRVGDTVTATVHGRERIVEVTQLLNTRVAAAVAAECFVDHSPPPPPREYTAPFLVRDRSTGRPTKKHRRELDRFRRQ